MAARPRTPRIPRRYRRSIPETRFQRTVLRRIHLDRDRSFTDGAFARSEGRRSLREDLSPEELARIAGVLRDIRKNRGLLKTGRLAVLLAIVGAGVVFSMVFKDRLAERAAEDLLTRAVGAQVDIDGLSIRLLSGSVSLDRLAATDPEGPTINIFELGATELTIAPDQLLLGRVIVDRMAATGFALDTPRDTPGRVLDPDARRDGGVTPERAAQVVDDTRDAATATIADLGLDIDPVALVDGIRDDLSVVALADRLRTQAAETRTFWSARVDEAGSQVAAIEERAAGLADTDPRALQSPDALAALASEVTATYEAVDRLYRDVAASHERLQSDVAAVRGAAEAVQDAAATDLAALRGRIPDVSVDPREFSLSVLRGFLQNAFGSNYDTGMRVIGILQRLAARPDAAPQDAPGRGGVDISFGPAAPPRFWLREAVVAGSDGTGAVELRLRDVSTDPDRVGAPTAIDLSLRDLRAGATVDLRRDAPERATVTVSGAGVPLDTPQEVAAAGFRGLGGRAAVDLAGVLDPTGSLSGELAVTASELSVSTDDAAPAAIGIVADAVERAGTVTADLAYTVSDGRLVSLTGDTSLTELMRGELDRLVADARARIERRIEAELDRLIEEQLAPYRDQIAALDQLEGRSLAELTDARTYRDAVAAQRDAAADQLAGLRAQLEEEARRRAAELEAQARAEAEAAAAEAEARARAEAEAAAEAAREQATDTVRDRAGDLGLPGFGD